MSDEVHYFREDVQAVYDLLTAVNNALEIGLQHLPDHEEVWKMINFVEKLQAEVRDEDFESLEEQMEYIVEAENMNRHIRAAARALDCLREAHGDFDSTPDDLSALPPESDVE